MKKIIFLAVCLIFASSSAFAAATITMALTSKTTTGKSVYGDVTGTTATTSSPLIGKTSTGVGVSMAANSLGYALTTQHMSGTKVFGSNYDSTSIAAKAVATVGTVEQQVTAWTDTFTSTGWTAL